MLVSQMCPALCDPVDCNPPGSSVHGIFQARILEYVAFPSPGDLPDPGIKLGSPALQADSLPSESWEKPLNDVTSNLFWNLLLMDCSPPGSSVHGNFQARILEWVAISYSRGSSPPRDQTPGLLHWQADSFPLRHLGSHIEF